MNHVFVVLERVCVGGCCGEFFNKELHWFCGKRISLMVAYICILMRLQTLMLLLLSRYDFAFSALHWYRCAVGKGECCLYHVSIFCVGSV